jgi:ERCC4-type nuclease
LENDNGGDILIAPTEPAFLRSLGRTSSLPEKHGCDFLIPVAPSFVGVQRKAVSDLLASLTDGRLGKEVAQIASSTLLCQAILIIEGDVEWTNENILIQAHHRFTKDSWYGMLLSTQRAGLNILQTGSLKETSELLQYLPKYASRPHRSLLTRPKPQSSWGKGTNASYASHLLQSFQGVGVVTAQAILDRFGGPPLEWNVSEEELASVPGIGKLTARRLMNALAKHG